MSPDAVDMIRSTSLATLLSLPLYLAATAALAQQPARTGIMIMAHGGISEWDQAVAEAIQPIKERIPTALALGMADPHTMQAALDSLAAQGVEKFAVVRLFLSGESFLHDTEFYLRLREDAPVMTMAMMMSHGSGQPHDIAPPQPLNLSGEILLETRGLSEAPEVAEIVGHRAKHVSVDPASESVIVVAHGMGDEGENQRLLDHMEASLEQLRRAGFKDVRSATLREDWPEARKVAADDIRAWVGSRAERGDRVIVVPFRLFGFGRYAEVLSGLEYVPADGLLPHDLVSEWVAQSAADLFCAQGIANPLRSCTPAH